MSFVLLLMQKQFKTSIENLPFKHLSKTDEVIHYIIWVGERHSGGCRKAGVFIKKGKRLC